MPNHERARPHLEEPQPPIGLQEVLRSVEHAWEEHVRAQQGDDEVSMAEAIVADPSRHPWRLVEAALGRLACPDCGSRLADGPVGCPACDEAHGFRFAAREPDREGVPMGNEHAIRVSTAVLRAPDRYPAWAVSENALNLPLFLAGEMPTRREQEVLLAAARQDARFSRSGVRTFHELAARAEAALAKGS